MKSKAAILTSFIVGAFFTGLTAWKGHDVAITVCAGAALTLHGIATLAAALKVLPAKDAQYIEALEDALQEHAPEMAQKVIRQ
jgi:hypothetical protein